MLVALGLLGFSFYHRHDVSVHKTSAEKTFLNNGRLKGVELRDMYKMIWLEKSLKEKFKDSSEETFHNGNLLSDKSCHVWILSFVFAVDIYLHLRKNVGLLFYTGTFILMGQVFFCHVKCLMNKWAI